MSIARASRIRNEMCYIRVCIDTYDKGEIRGRLFNAYYRDALFFDSSMDMLRQMDEVFETFGYPHATMDLRRFEASDEENPNEGKHAIGTPAAVAPATAKKPTAVIHVAPSQTLYEHNAMGREATLKLRIMFRQNASWQGTAKWVEENQEKNFQSVLELLLLIDSIFS